MLSIERLASYRWLLLLCVAACGGGSGADAPPDAGPLVCDYPVASCFSEDTLQRCETNISDDDAHCGGCNLACDAEARCIDGSCECEIPNRICTDGCVDVLSDPLNCGSCGNACATGTCVDGYCGAELLLTEETQDFGSRALLAVDATHIYWSDPRGDIRRATLTGENPMLVAERGDGGPTALLISGGHIYWTTAETLRGGFYRAPKGGGPREDIVVGLPSAGLLAEPGGMVWATSSGTNVPAELHRWNEASGNVTSVATLDGEPEAIDSRGLTRVGDVLYWLVTDPSRVTARIFSFPAGGGALQLFYVGVEVTSLTSAGTTLFWTTDIEDRAGDIVAASTLGGEPVILSANRSRPSQLTAADDMLVWSEGDAQLVFMPQAGGIPDMWRNSLNLPRSGVAYDESFWYWTFEEFGEQMVYRLERTD